MVDDAKLHQFMGQMLSDLGGAASVALVRIGDALGLYKTLHELGPMTVTELAAAAGGQPALPARMALASGGFGLPLLRSGDAEVRSATGTGDGIRDRGQPRLHDGGV